MKTFVILSMAAIAMATAMPNQVSETIDEFDQEMGIVVLDDDLKAEEEQRLKEVEAEINARDETKSGMKLYPWSDLSKEQVEAEKMGLSREWDPSRGDAPPERRAMGLVMPPESERINTDEELDSLYAADRGYTPAAYFAVNDGLVTVAKNQGNCGSCAAFAAHGLHETCMAKAGAPTRSLDLSEQYLVDCGYNGGSMNGCKGAGPHAYTDWFAYNGGVAPHEGSYPYLDNFPNLNCNKGRLAKKWNSGAKVVSSIKDWSCSESKLKKMVYEKGAVLVGVYASDDSFLDYDGNRILDDCSYGKDPNHAVLVVGYGRENGQDYWLIKNSWGKNWGLNGHIKLRRGTNECGVEDICISANCVSSGRQETAPTTPKPPPIPFNMWCDITNLIKPGQKLTGTYNIRTKGPHGGFIDAEVRCKNNSCTPATPGPSNACMYICGRVKC